MKQSRGSADRFECCLKFLYESAPAVNPSKDTFDRQELRKREFERLLSRPMSPLGTAATCIVFEIVGLREGRARARRSGQPASRSQIGGMRFGQGVVGGRYQPNGSSKNHQLVTSDCACGGRERSRGTAIFLEFRTRGSLILLPDRKHAVIPLRWC
jgi:hypothetical protein